jgi:hypothetical protein
MLLLEGMASIRSCLAAIVCQSTPPAFPQFSVHKFFLQDPMSALGRKATITRWNLSHAFERMLTGQEQTPVLLVLLN